MTSSPCQSALLGKAWAGNSSSLVQLPQEVLLQVLRQLPQQDRLGRCANTCSTLHAAAGQATQEVLCSGEISQHRADALVAWLTRNRSSVLSQLSLGGGAWSPNVSATVCLPWHNLCQLTSLHLGGIIVEQAEWSGLGQLQLLQRLSLEKLDTPNDSSHTAAAYTVELGSVLGQLVQLTELSLSAKTRPLLGGAVLAGGSKLSRLQVLKLEDVASKECPVWLHTLPTSLTSLDIDCTTTSDDPSVVWQLQCLEQLVVADCQLPATALLHMPQLQYFSCMDDPIMGFVGMEFTFPYLQHLRTLHLSWFGKDVPAADFAALTTSSCLTSLVLSSGIVPTAAVRHVFGQGLLLPHLKQFITSCAEITDGDFESALENIDEWSLLVDEGDVQRIVSSCPALQSLGTLRIAEGLPHAQLRPLLQLSALTELSIGGAGCTDAVAEQVLAQMTGLECLIIVGAAQLTALGLWHLTTLTALTHLRAEGCNTVFHDGDAAAGAGISVEGVDLSSAESQPVWQLLQYELTRNPSVLAVLFDRQVVQLWQVQQQLACAQQQLEHQRIQHTAQLQVQEQQHAAALLQRDEELPLQKAGLLRRSASKRHSSKVCRRRASLGVGPGLRTELPPHGVAV